jgi:PAS domain S-box-containing protein/putative nucleotidyltransferase with HDIG domain
MNPPDKLHPDASLAKQAADLRLRAEAQFKENAAQYKGDVLSPAAAQQLLHELGVHQIELEMQNEDLRESRNALEVSRLQFFDLYDLAPVGYCTLDEAGMILQANLTLATLLGVARGALVKQSLSHYIFKAAQDTYYLKRQQLMESGVVQAFDLRMVKQNGDEFWAHVTATAAKDTQGGSLHRVVLTDISELKRVEEALRVTQAELQDSLEGTMRAIGHIGEIRDPYTAGHQIRVADLASAIATQMALPDEQVHTIYLAATVHDVGKIKIPAEILSWPGNLGDIELSLIKLHVQGGYDILKEIKFPQPIDQIVLQHHERLDGSGYPQGLKGNAILLEARIISVADVVDAMASNRPYRPSLGLEAALAEITKFRGTLFDPCVVDACLAVFREQHYSFTG